MGYSIRTAWRSSRLLQCWIPSRIIGEPEDQHGGPPPDLPLDLWITIFHQLDLKSLASVEGSCREFRDVVRRTPALFRSAFPRIGRPPAGHAAELLDAFTSRPGVDWRRACMFRIGLEAILEYSRRREEVLLLKYVFDACTQTLSSDKIALKMWIKKAKEHQGAVNRARMHGDLAAATQSLASRDECLTRKTAKEDSIRIWKSLLPHFKERMQDVGREEGEAKQRLVRIYNGFPTSLKVQCSVPRTVSGNGSGGGSGVQGLPTLRLIRRMWRDDAAQPSSPSDGHTLLQQLF